MIALAKPHVQNDHDNDLTPDIVGRSVAFRQAIQHLPEIASCHAPVLILGETGTGKELLARTIHDRGPRAGAPFIAQNCASIPLELAESELFGHKAGAFSGALRDKPGIVELANRGTLFLDEIAELQPAMQAKLLRVLEDRKVRRVGDIAERCVDFRLICATNRDIDAEVREGRFRKDLLYRINLFTMTLPPLSRRAGDIYDLARGFLVRAAIRADVPTPEISDEAIKSLQEHPWPGNVRELANVVERAFILAHQGTIEVDHLHLAPVEAPAVTLPEVLQRMEQGLIRDAIRTHSGNISRAAISLGISRQRLQQLVHKYELARSNYAVHGVGE